MKISSAFLLVFFWFSGSVGVASNYIFPFSEGVDIPLGTTGRSDFSFGLRVTGQSNENGVRRSWYLERPGQQHLNVSISNSYLAREIAKHDFTDILADLGSGNTVGGIFENGRLIIGQDIIESGLNVVLGSDLTLGMYTDPDQSVAGGFERSRIVYESDNTYIEVGGGMRTLYTQSQFEIGLPEVDEKRVEEGLERLDANFGINLGPIPPGALSPLIDQVNQLVAQIPILWKFDLHTLELTPYIFFEAGHEFEMGGPVLHSITPYVRLDVGYGLLGLYGEPGQMSNVDLLGLASTDGLAIDDPFGIVCHGGMHKVELGTRITDFSERASLSRGIVHQFARRYNCFETDDLQMETGSNTHGFIEFEILLGN